MGKNVYANGNEISCKGGDGKVIAAFPDVCLSPPPPPAGPIPVPYPNSSFAKDMQSGSKTVVIGGSEVMLKDKSFYKSSPLGDEAATRNFGANVINHGISGKTYFVAWSMDVKFEGENVDRHIDLTTSNHSSPAGTAAPSPNVAAMLMAKIEDGAAPPKCVCCKGSRHSSGTPESFNKFYARAGKPAEFKQLMKDMKNRASAAPPCTCNKPLVPKAPCNVFRYQPPGPARDAEYNQIKLDWKNARKAYQTRHGIPSEATVMASLAPILGRPPNQAEIEAERKVNHLVPKTAGGCPTGDGNLQPNGELCTVCRALDKRFGDLQALIH